MIIQHNIAAINSYRNLSINQTGLNKNLEKLSSGYKINRAGDDAAGLAISESMRSQIHGLDQATRNAQDAIGLIQTAEGALTEVHAMLQRMTTLATQAANGTYNSIARANVQSEINALTEEIDRIADYTEFNGIKPLAFGKENIGKMTFQIGPSQKETITVEGRAMTAKGIQAEMMGGVEADKKRQDIHQIYRYDDKKGWLLKDDATLDTYAGIVVNEFGPKMGVNLDGRSMLPTGIEIEGTDTELANKAIVVIDLAIDVVSSYRAELGAAQNRLEHTINNLKVTSENITAAESRIRDTDMADEITAFTKNNILLQASQSMLSQSNSVPQSVLSLIQ